MNNNKWQALYDYLEGVLKTFLNDFQAHPVVNPSPRFLIDLMPANGNLGAQLLSRTTMTQVKRYLDGAALVNAPGVGLQIQFPLLDAGMMGQYAVKEYLKFFVKVAEEVRQRGLLLYTETSPVFAGTKFSDVVVDYAGMTTADYVQRRTEMARLIIAEIAPDYLSLAHEVSTERMLTGIDVTDADMIAALHDLSLWENDENETRVGGGLPSWEGGDGSTYAEAGEFYNAHVYPIATYQSLHQIFHKNFGVANYTLVALSGVMTGLPAGVERVIGETWLYKAHPWEIAGDNPMERAERIYARDYYDIWEPLDALFLQALHLLAQVAGISYINLFWSRHLFAYLTDRRDGETELNKATLDAIRDGRLTQAGEVCRQLNLS